jgi:hypothetical protein
MPSVAEPEHATELRWLPQFGVVRLFVAMTCVAVGAACYQFFGPKSFYGVCCVIHGLAPTLAILSFVKLNDLQVPTRMAIALLSLVLMTAAMALLTALFFNTDAVAWLLLAMLVEWPGQIPFALVLLLLLRETRAVE